LCCKVLEITELKKPTGSWCGHCKPGVGCAIHDHKPAECTTFVCGYLSSPNLSEAWKPSEAHFVVARDPRRSRIAINVDPGRPDAWKREPFYSTFKRWARAALPNRDVVVVSVAKRTIVVFPDRDVDLGIIGDDETLLIRLRATPRGPQWDATRQRRAEAPAAAEEYGPASPA
jgi:hypothetical protein